MASITSHPSPGAQIAFGYLFLQGVQPNRPNQHDTDGVSVPPLHMTPTPRSPISDFTLSYMSTSTPAPALPTPSGPHPHPAIVSPIEAAISLACHKHFPLPHREAPGHVRQAIPSCLGVYPPIGLSADVSTSSFTHTTSPATAAIGFSSGTHRACHRCTLARHRGSTSVPRGSGSLTACRRYTP